MLRGNPNPNPNPAPQEGMMLITAERDQLIARNKVGIVCSIKNGKKKTQKAVCVRGGEGKGRPLYVCGVKKPRAKAFFEGA